jgi:hypothetical protein
MSPPLLPNLRQTLPRLPTPHPLHQPIRLLRLPPLPATQPQRRHALRQILLYRCLGIDHESAVVLRAVHLVTEVRARRVCLQLEDARCLLVGGW